MSSKARRHRTRKSGDTTEVAARTGVVPAPGEVVSKKQKSLMDSNKARAKERAGEGIIALDRGDFAGAGNLFHEAAQAANLANAAKVKGGSS